MDLDERLRIGPLRVGAAWRPEQTARLSREVLRRRRRRFAVRSAATVVAICGIGLFASRGLVFSGDAQEVAAPHALDASPIRMGQAADFDASKQLVFSDGSTIEILEPNSAVQITEDTAARMRATLLTGEARFRVVPGSKRVFEVEVGAVHVRVLGTIFTVTREDSQVHVTVQEGLVHVQWPEGTRELSAGQSGRFSQESAKQEPISEPPPEAAPRAVEKTLTWRDYAHQGNYRAAYKEMRKGGRDPIRDEPGDLMLAADVARLSLHPADAVKPLQTVVNRFPRDSRAPVAAFTLGRVLLDDLGRAASAAQAFQQARTLWPKGPLAKDALAREVEAWNRAGQRTKAEALAREYLELYPSGQHAATMRKHLEGAKQSENSPR